MILPENMQHIMEHVPFLAATTGRFNGIRIFEAVIIAVIVAFGTSYITVEKMKVEFAQLKKEVSQVIKTIDTLHPRK